MRRRGAVPISEAIAHRYIRRVRGMGQDDGSIDLGYSTAPVDTGMPLPPVDVLSGLPNAGAISTSSLGQPLNNLKPSSPTTTADITQFLNALTKGAASGVQIYNATQTPALIAGTNAIYNPATGQYYNPSTGQVVNPLTGNTLGTATGSLLSSPYILMGGLLIGGLLLVSMIGGRR